MTRPDPTLKSVGAELPSLLSFPSFVFGSSAEESDDNQCADFVCTYTHGKTSKMAKLIDLL